MVQYFTTKISFRGPNPSVISMSTYFRILFSIYSLITWSIDCVGHEHDRIHHDSKLIAHEEKLAELYRNYPYDYVSKYNRFANHNIRKRNWCHDYEKVTPDFPCLRGVTPIGFDTYESIDDGHKFGCGIGYISNDPIVYSFGSNQQQDFELAFLDLRPTSKIFTFDILESHLPKPAVRHEAISYTLVGLGGFDTTANNELFKPLSNLMIARNHSYIDVLKVDIEGGEWAWIENEADILQRVGQLLIEVHIGCDEEMVNILKFPKKDFFYMAEFLELQGLRMFYRELNPMWPECCSEFSFIQKDWGKWDADKGSLSPLKPFIARSVDPSLEGKYVMCSDKGYDIYFIEHMLRRLYKNGADYPENHKSPVDEHSSQIIKLTGKDCNRLEQMPIGPTMWYQP